jgi:hypothetical protein
MRVKILCFFIFISFIGFSQEVKPIQTDRPDQTETPSLVPQSMFQVETGISYQENNSNNSTITLPSTLWKYGVNANFELRLITEFSIDKINSSNFSGLNPVLVGFKSKIAEEKGIFPKTSFIGHISLPNVASSNNKTEYFAPEFRFVMQHTLSNKLSYSYNLGAEWDGFSPQPTFIYTTALGYSISKKMGSYIELFGFLPQKEKSNHSFDGGITYLINNNFMLDLSSGIGLTSNAPNYYIAFGFSFRI